MADLSKATPMPWKKQWQQLICDNSGDLVACMAGSDNVREDNRELIVHAVNCHDELVAALEAARTQISALGTPDDAVNNSILSMVDTAVSIAKGETP